jgi:hypothetical protein
MFKEQITGRTDNPFLIMRAKLHDRLGPQGRETVRAKAAQSMFDTPDLTPENPWAEFQHEGYKFRARQDGDDLLVELTGEPTLNEALKARGLSHKRDGLTGADGRHSITDEAGAFIGGLPLLRPGPRSSTTRNVRCLTSIHRRLGSNGTG